MKDTSKVVNLAEIRSKRNDSERRQVKRHFLHEILQFFCVPGGGTMCPVEVLEGSETGCSFRVPHEKAGQIVGAESPAFRIYLSRDSFILVGFRIVKAVDMTENGRKYMRFGCEIDRTYSSYPAYQQLLRFVDSYSELSVKETRQASGA
jgi:hypothetical protein